MSDPYLIDGGRVDRTAGMELADVMAELEKLGNATTKKTWLRHGATEPLFGVKIGDMKVLLKKLKGRQDLALQLLSLIHI